MSIYRNCRHCGDSFNTQSPAKVRAGGYIDECVSCLDDMGGESGPPKYLGVAAGNGKMTDVTILQFDDSASREQYRKSWMNNSGYNKGKSCQLGSHLTPMTGMKFRQVAENRGNDNHKGKG